jgi:hypothetical protein
VPSAATKAYRKFNKYRDRYRWFAGYAIRSAQRNLREAKLTNTMQFNVTVCREVSQTGTLRVDAKNKEEAEEKAIAKCAEGDVTWWDDTRIRSEACVITTEEHKE